VLRRPITCRWCSPKISCQRCRKSGTQQHGVVPGSGLNKDFDLMTLSRQSEAAAALLASAEPPQTGPGEWMGRHALRLHGPKLSI
jgi:hypothetical protein